MADACLLPPSVEQLIQKICIEQKQPPLGLQARLELASLGEEAALDILHAIAVTGVKKSFDGFVIYLAKQKAADGSPIKRFCLSQTSTQQPSCSSTSTRMMMHQQCESIIQSSMSLATSSSSETASRLGIRISPQLQALGELEFRKAFLILSYIGGYKLEEVLFADEIRRMEHLPMAKFEAEIWKAVGSRCGYIREHERVKVLILLYLVWDCGWTHIYHCHVSSDGTYRFKGPYLTMMSNFLQRTLGDDNVLMVKFAEEDADKSCSTSSSIDYFAKYGRLAREGILVGLRRYRFFVFKDGGKEEKKKNPTTSPVKCFFVRTQSDASRDHPNHILDGKTIRQARSTFMNVDKLPSLSNYMARFSLILSKTVNFEVDLSAVKIEKINDIPCRDNDGNVVKGNDGKYLIHTDGTGFISEDLALKCPKKVHKGKCINGNEMERLLDCNGLIGKSSEIKFSESNFGEPPLLIQFRLFHNGGAVKGTLLVNKKLCPGTIQVRPSMIKVEADSMQNACTKSSFEIVGTSNRPKRAYLSRNLIALLSYGGVPQEFFMDLLNNALEDAKGALSKKHAALQVAIINGEMDDYMVARMLFSGIPLEESYIQYHQLILMREEKKCLKGGRIPIPESYYLMGTTDPTGTLEGDEVCVILENGQVSGKVMVYRNPGLHFGDIHILKATYVEGLNDFVGNAKYAIFFPCKGPRSLADEMAGGDYDGDLYFVSRNPELVDKFNQSEPWCPPFSNNNVPNKKPGDFSDEELEDELFRLFLMTRFQPSYTVGVAADSWLAMMDRLLILGDDRHDEKINMKKNMSELIDKYYDALDAPKKGGKKIELPDQLKAELFPHHLERKEEISYKSTSILGLIYDKVKLYMEEDTPKNVWKLHCFNDEVSESCLMKWKELYDQYRRDMTDALKSNTETKNEAANEVIKRYKEILYEATEFEESKRREEDIFEEALAIYNISYDYAKARGDAKYCGFAWKVAGQALCKLYSLKQSNGEKAMKIYTTQSTLKELFNK
ncbi:probable RNA-dependent RNA polymerase 5 isoform X2 [Hevea brasiliensis]|uniref:probable RNA-dependent RNA polymerase 5 isoform X2 n=1 Tax=Hevea brasiliensis TaxID=3981 RepID=UPI0025E76242|nr:probable RNA-dependent RNA polymerase 5 isoform X2 [Hevea brasiliensis]